MAASYTWPVTLPQKPLNGSFSESYGFNYIQTPMDAGPSKIRKRSNKANQMSMTFLMTTAQIGYLNTFLETTIGGVARFYFDHPRTESQIEVRVVPSSEGNLYSTSEAAPGYWNVSLTFEQMP